MLRVSENAIQTTEVRSCRKHDLKCNIVAAMQIASKMTLGRLAKWGEYKCWNMNALVRYLHVGCGHITGSAAVDGRPSTRRLCKGRIWLMSFSNEMFSRGSPLCLTPSSDANVRIFHFVQCPATGTSSHPANAHLSLCLIFHCTS